MQRYIQQLIEDLNNAETERIEDPSGDNYEEFIEMMTKLENGEKVSAKKLLGVSYEELPPPDMLTIQQTQDLLLAMLNALEAKGTSVSFPGNGAPVKLAYNELRNEFKEGFNSFPGWTIDFCSGWCPDCAFLDYCDRWKDTWTREELEKTRKNKPHCRWE